MKPPPTTTARLAWRLSTKARICWASSGVRTVNTPGRSTPGTGGTDGEAPTAMTQAS